jgi:hypothetical protein
MYASQVNCPVVLHLAPFAVTTKQATYVNYFRTRPLKEEPDLHGYLKAGLYFRRLPRKVIQSVSSLRRSFYRLRIETGRHKRHDLRGKLFPVTNSLSIKKKA